MLSEEVNTMKMNSEVISIRTTMTSSPITSTSGFLKCLKAMMLARHEQSSMLPASART